jgi:hypothetical protein
MDERQRPDELGSPEREISLDMDLGAEIDNTESRQS